MSAPEAGEGPYRQLARQSLQQAADRLNAIPKGQIATAELHAHSAFAQAVATIAVGQALIELGDALRAAIGESEDGS
jgi:hypothetical protein